jgi:hypothetical protein
MFSLIRRDKHQNADKDNSVSQRDTPDPSRFRKVEGDDGSVMYIDIEKSKEAMKRAMESIGID